MFFVHFSDFLLLVFNAKTDLLALTLVGPTKKDPVLNHPAVLHLDNQLSTINDIWFMVSNGHISFSLRKYMPSDANNLLKKIITLM